MGLLDKLKRHKTLSTDSINLSDPDYVKLQKFKKILENHMRDIKSQRNLTPTTKAEYGICEILLQKL